MYTGFEKLILDGKDLDDYSMLQFWRLTMSDILNSMARGTFAEYLVRCSLQHGGFDAFKEYNGTIRAWDINGPFSPVLNRDVRIEVKCAANVNTDLPSSKKYNQYKDTELKFGIKPSRDYLNGHSTPLRNSDLYVFCLYKAVSIEQNILDLNLWDFYVFPTYRIDNHPTINKQKTISVYRLKKLGIQPQNFSTLPGEINRVISEIESYTKSLESF